MFEVEMLPAREGDCLWIRYGSPTAPHQILIDTGRAATYKALRDRLIKLPPKQRTFELFVITHVDRDHIEGAMALLEDKNLPIKFNQIWFNGYDHLVSARDQNKKLKVEEFGAVQGERVTSALLKKQKHAWNRWWKRKPVVLQGDGLPRPTLPGGMKLTVLSPDRQKLVALIPDWEKECRAAGMVPGAKARADETLHGIEVFGPPNVEKLATTPFKADTTRPNGTCIVLLAEYKMKRALLGADSHADRLIASLKKLQEGKQRIPIDLFKVSHHGSDRNVSKELIELIDCPLYLFSTNGSYSHHPAAAAIARILKFAGTDVTIAFNYHSEFTDKWDEPALKTTYHYRTVYPDKKSNGTLTVPLAK